MFTVFKSLNLYTPKSIMGAVDPFKVPSPASMVCSENYRFNTNDVNRSLIVPSARWNLLPPGTLTRHTYTAT